MCEKCEKQNDTRWLALLIRQGLKLIVVGIERRYELGDAKSTSGRDLREPVGAPK